jgi:hypothetical protein
MGMIYSSTATPWQWEFDEYFMYSGYFPIPYFEDLPESEDFFEGALIAVYPECIYYYKSGNGWTLLSHF